jgi:[acyl-carrier-protein] S-malonyltransferase
MSLALLFSPQGSQAVGMGCTLATSSPAAADVFARADAALGWSVSGLAWGGPQERLNDTRQTQPCLVTTSLACLAALREADPSLDPAFVAGHSVGEYAALVAADALSLQDALRLVERRGALMAEAGDGGMLAVIGLTRETVADTLAHIEPADIVIANDNAPGQVVVSGGAQALERGAEALRAAGAKRVIPLRVSGPFHSPAMRGVGEQLARAFDDVTWRDATTPLISNVTARPVSDAAQLRELLARQVSAPVEWVACVRHMVDGGVDTFVECGPGSALTGMVRRIAPEARTLNVNDPVTLAAAVEALRPARAGASV